MLSLHTNCNKKGIFCSNLLCNAQRKNLNVRRILIIEKGIKNVLPLQAIKL
jgi:hypothetical protein